MKRKNIFISLCLTLSMLWGLTACSSEDSVSDSQTVKTVNGFYVQKVNFICEAPGYDQGTTRAVTYNWKNYTSLFARFKSGSNYYIGYISIAPDGWHMISTTEFINMTTSGTCELYYLLESNGDNYYMNMDTGKLDVYNNGSFVKSTDIAWNASSINLTEGTAVYATTTATYSKEKENGWTIQAMLNPMLWRMRFSGSNGTSITLPGSDNDIKYVSAFNWSTSAVSFDKTAKDVNLTVSGGYTPYIYGEFIYSYAKNTITVVNGSNTFYREFSSSNLPAGKSGYFTIPTTSNYSNNGWTMKQDVDQNATIQPDYLVTFTDGVVTDWKVGSTVSTFDHNVLTKSYAESLSDDELAAEIYGTDPTTKEDYDKAIGYASTSWFSPDTEYYLCAVAKNSSGKRGPVLRYKFKTNSSSLPYAQISNVKAASSTKWTYDIALKNNAKSYYLATSLDASRYSSDWHFWAWIVHYGATTGQLETYDWESVETTLKSGTCDVITIGTWGVSSNGTIGNPDVAYGNVSSSAPKRVLTETDGKFQKISISRKDLEKMMENTRLYRINQ